MIQYLKIENLALLDSVALEFSEGFQTVTGETGAGKSVLLGALSLLSGARSDKGLIRQGTEQCLVEGALDAARIPKWMLLWKNTHCPNAKKEICS